MSCLAFYAPQALVWPLLLYALAIMPLPPYIDKTCISSEHAHIYLTFIMSHCIPHIVSSLFLHSDLFSSLQLCTNQY